MARTSTLFQKRFSVFHFLVSAVSVVALSGCLEQPGCSTPLDKTVTASLQGTQIVFSPLSLSFLSSPDTKLTSVDLMLTLQGARGKDKNNVPDDIQMDVNGISSNTADGSKPHDDFVYDAKKNQTTVRFHLVNLSLNGGQSFNDFVSKLLKNLGTLKFGLHGKDIKVLSASARFVGSVAEKCPNPPKTPTPPPPPAPVAPTTTLKAVTPADAVTSSREIKFDFTSDQSGVNFTCAIDNAAAAPCTSPQTYSALADGSHAFVVSGTNAAGLSDKNKVTYSWRVDATAPSVTITDAANLPTLVNSTSRQFAFQSDDAAATFLCSLDGGAETACASPVKFDGLSEGPHKIAIAATDALGNRQDPAASFAWTVDLTAPVARILQADPSSSPNNSASENINFAASESASFECAVDQGAFQACASPLALSGLSEGAHRVDVRATDLAGNLGAAVSYSWATDFTAPQIALGNVIPAIGLTNGKSVSVAFAVTEPGSVVCTFDGVAKNDCASPFSGSVATEGVHTLIISAKDAAGNAAADASVQWTMDFSAPILSFGAMSPSASAAINSAALGIEVNSSKKDTLRVSLDGVVLTQTASPIQLANLAEGAHHLEVSASDAAGNSANVITHDFTVDLTAPVVTLAEADARALTNQTNETFTFSSDEAANLQCQIDDAGFADCVSPIQISGLAEGSHRYDVRATDAAGNVSTVQSFAWTVDVTAPVATVSASVSPSADVTFNFSFDDANATYTCTLDGQPVDGCRNGMVLSGFAAGDHAFTVTAKDAAGNVDTNGKTATFTILAPLATTITSVTPALTNQTSMSLSFTASRDGASFQCSLDGASFAPCVSPVTVANLLDAQHRFTVRAITADGQIDLTGATAAWTVDTTSPVVITLSASSSGAALNISWVTNELATGKVFWGLGTDVSRTTAEDTVLAMNHTVKLIGLSPNTQYSIQVSGQDAAGNAYLSTKRQVRTGF